MNSLSSPSLRDDAMPPPLGHGPALRLVHGRARKTPVHRLAAERANAVEQMRDLRARGLLTFEARQEIAARLGVVERTVRNWLIAADAGPNGEAKNGPCTGRRPFTLTQKQLDARAQFGSDTDFHLWLLAENMRANKEATAANGGVPTVVAPEVHRTTVSRALARHDNALVAGLRHGAKAVAATSLRFAQDHPLGQTWSGDLMTLPMLVRMRAGGRAFHPQWFAFREPRTGRIMAEALLPERPDATMIAAIVGQGLMTQSLLDGTALLPPRQLRLDNAGEHVSQELAVAMASVGISVVPNTDSYASWQNGIIERFWSSTDLGALTQLPGSPLLGLQRDGETYKMPGGALPGFDDVQAFLTRTFVPYFNSQEHSGVRDGRVPDQVWAEEAADAAVTSRPWPSDELVARLALAPRDNRRQTQTVHPLGVKVGARYLTSTLLGANVGDAVAVRRWPNAALRTAEVFTRDGRTYLARVKAHEAIGDEERRYVRCAERTNRDRIDSLKHRAVARFGTAFELITGPAADANTRADAAGTTPDWQPGEEAAATAAELRELDARTATTLPDSSSAKTPPRPRPSTGDTRAPLPPIPRTPASDWLLAHPVEEARS